MSPYASPGPARPSLKPVLIAVLLAFALGAALVGYLAWRGYLTPLTGSRDEPQTAAALPSAAAPLPARTPSATTQVEVARVAEVQGGIDQRLAAAEQRIARLDLQAQAASGNAARAEGLLIAFATRRALERGAPLGYLADQLRLRFGDAQPNSVKTVINFAASPITLDVLLARLDGLGPDLKSPERQPALTRLRQELSSLFVIRRETTPSPQPQRRLDRARLFLESGRVDKAIAEVEQLPGAASAASWIADARRYERAQQALDLLETAAVREPRLLRDGDGQAVQQPSPVDDAVPGSAAQPAETR